MAGLLDDHGSGYHPVVATGGGDDGHQGWWAGMWIFAIVIIFFALLLIWRRDEKHHGGNIADGLAPAMAMGYMAKQNHEPHYEYDRGHMERWDIVRDQLRDTGDMRKEMAMLTLGQSREMDKYFYEQRAATEQARFDTLLGFKDSEIRELNNACKILERVDAMERRQDEKFSASERRADREIIRKQGERLNVLETILSMRRGHYDPATV